METGECLGAPTTEQPRCNQAEPDPPPEVAASASGGGARRFGLSFWRFRPTQGARFLSREVSLGTSSARMGMLALLGLVLGGAGGAAAYLVFHLVGLISNLALLHRVGFELPDLRRYHPTPVLLPIALGGAAVVVALARWSPIIKGHGIPESLEAILFRESRISPRAAVAKPVSAAVAMGTGGPFGAEGPIIVTGASIGSIVGQILPVSNAERRILLAVGAAAGMAGVFGTPVAAVVLAFELLLFERSLRALLPLIISTAVAGALHDVLISSHPLFAVRGVLLTPPGQLPLFAILGIASGGLAVLLNRGLFVTESVFRRLPLPEWSHPLVGAIGYASVGLMVPGSLSVGYWAITDAVNNRFTLAAAALLCVAKMVSWWIGLGSNTSGGTLAPMFLVGATMGEVVGIGFAHAFPGAHIQPGAFALVGMGACFGAGARALLTGVVFAAEVTGSFGLLIPLLVATACAETVAELGLGERIMTDKLFRRGYRVDFDTQTDPLRMRVAGTVMEPRQEPGPPASPAPPPPDSSPAAQPDADPRGSEAVDGAAARPSIDRWDYLADALPLLLNPGCFEVAVTDRGKVVGTVNWAHVRAEMFRRVADEEIHLPSWGPWHARSKRRDHPPAGDLDGEAGRQG